MNKGMVSGLAVAGLLVVGLQAAQAATLTGVELAADYLLPDSSTTYPGGTPTGPFTVGAGVDAVINVEGVTDLSLDFDSNMLTVTLNTTLTNPTWNTASFNGIHITAASGMFTSFGLSSATISPITTSFDADELFINWAGASYVDGSTAVFDIGYEVASVPLPAGFPLVLTGLFGFAWLRRRKVG